VTEHFLSPDVAFRMLDAIRKGMDPYGIVAELELHDDDR
jgi:helicase